MVPNMSSTSQNKEPNTNTNQFQLSLCAIKASSNVQNRHVKANLLLQQTTDFALYCQYDHTQIW